MKKVISMLLCLCLIMAIAPPQFVAEAWPARILPEKSGLYEKYKPLDGLEWLKNQEAIEKIVEEETARPDGDFSIYDMAKQSIIFKIGDPISFAEGYKLYIDSKNHEVKPFIKDDRAFVPLRFIAESLKLKIKWDGEAQSVTLSNSANKLIFTVGKNEIDVNGEKKEIDASPVNENGRIFVPLRAIAESLGKEVIYEDGIVIVTSEDGKELLTDAHLSEIAKADFDLDRERVMHPQPQSVIRWMMSSGNRNRLNWDDEKIAELITPYMNMSYYDLAKHIEEVTMINGEAPRHIGERPPFEQAGQMMSLLYERTGNEDYALRIILMLYHEAIHFDDLVTDDRAFFYNFAYVTPETLLFAYDKIYHSPMWKIASEAYGFDLKQVISEWVGVIYDYITVNRIGLPVGNYPTWIGAISGVAMILDDPDRMRDLILVFEEAFKPYNFYADGMWYEGSFDYATQMVGNVGSGINIVNNYRDPFGYVDEKYGYELRNGLTGSDEWSDFSNHVNSLSKLSYYPDGSRYTVNDTHWNESDVNLADMTIKEQYVKDNIEMNHFGVYGLRYGDKDEAQQLNFTLQTSSSISHQHGSPLGISYFAGGTELLPDQGYVTPTTLHRYSTTTTYGHNLLNIGGPSNLGNNAYWMGPNVIAYDNGSRNNKQVQVIEGSQLMTDETEAEINRRALMMIATDKNHSYVVDIQRAKGNTCHEVYLHQSEDEDVEMTTSLTLPERKEEKIFTWLSSMGIFSGMLTKHTGYSGVIKNPAGLKTADSFDFSWKGKTSGSTLNAFIKGQKNTVVAFADYPTLRRTKKDVALKDSFPGYIMYRGREVTPDDTSLFGSVYEGFRDGEEAKVKDVTWYEPDDGDPMTAMLKVEGIDFTDYVYVSNDMESRTFEGVTFKGNYAMLRKDKEGNVKQGYIYGEGSINDGSYTLEGKKDVKAKVVYANGARAIYEDVENVLKVNGALPKDIEGLWCNVTFSDNSGTAYRIEEVRESVAKIHNDPGFTVDKSCARFTAYPMYEYHDEKKLADFAQPYNDDMEQRYREGDVIFTVKYPTFDVK